MNKEIDHKANQDTGEKIYKESPVRSILKAISWRIIASFTTFLIVFVVFREAANKEFDEAFEKAGYITAIEAVAKMLFYYLHERAWTNIRWGKYWRRTYWRKRAWRRLYNKMHEPNKT